MRACQHVLYLLEDVHDFTIQGFGAKYISHFFASKLLLNGNNFIPLYSSVFKGIPDEPGRLCDGETSE